MIAVDTNILVRFLVNDDAEEATLVYKRLKQAEETQETLYISSAVILELIWVLEAAYNISRANILKSLALLITMPVFKFEDITALQNFLPEAENSSYDLSDLLIAYSAKGAACEHVLTFDKKASKHELFELLK